MKPLLILKLGSTTPALAQSHGDMEDWIEARLHLLPGQVSVVDPHVEPLPDPQRYSGVILTGSHSMVTDREDWSERTARWILSVMEREIPLLGICYGHQLIAYARGAEVGVNPRGREIGTVEITLRDPARTDALFASLPTRFRAHASHTQSVLRLPPGATWLASSDRDPHHAYRIGAKTWGVQFHPEFDVLVMRAYVEKNADDLRAQGDDPGQLLQSTADTPHAEELLRRFGEFAS
jgi:GMP synthase (glutamine-hydrolysing)